MSVLGEWCIVGMPNYGCVTGAFADGWADLQPAGSLFGDIRFRQTMDNTVEGFTLHAGVIREIAFERVE